jgi:hypothetical protein
MFVVRIDQPGHEDHGKYLVSEKYWVGDVTPDLQGAKVWTLRNGATRRANSYRRDGKVLSKVWQGPNCVVVPVTLVAGEPVKTKKPQSPEGVP